ncbi:Protein of unknown function [Mesonia phycicola]|uniref:DUF2851 domain-containing protein n=1 Tax=Mesonia phycicola TaxID=579105 RepID=A0A1M6GHI7_9FLAO|nr:DUF2851 family protein [Mesonia phycicola]SHJ09371.1 Protein of unknown function [Mesonia phycicola]
MKEDFLHYLWKFKKFSFLNVFTTQGEKLEILNSGWHNTENSGPDFFNAKIKIGNQLWAGNVEIHINSSHWYAHQHEQDAAYDNVILHVVWEHDVEVFRSDKSEIATLQLKDYCNLSLLKNYENLLNSTQKWINCEKDFFAFKDFQLHNWLEKLYIQRLETKSILIFEKLKETDNDWEAVLFQLLLKNFGLNKNGAAFLELAQSIPFSIIRKLESTLQLEALVMGQANLLIENKEDVYYQQLKKEYQYLKHKFSLTPICQNSIHFFRLRPSNFPTIRLSQLMQLYKENQHLFSQVKDVKSLEEFYTIFKVNTSDYWQTHYSFGKESKKLAKNTTKSFINLLVINTLLPLQFAYQKYIGKENVDDLFTVLKELKAEENSIIKKFNNLRKDTAKTALDSQALLQLKSFYCDKNKCLQCELGVSLLQSTRS